MLSMLLIKLHFQLKFIKFTNDFMYNCDINILREKKQATNVSANDKWKFCYSITICRILNISASATIWRMAHKNVNTLSMKKEDDKFQVRCMSYLNSKQNKAPKEQIYKCLSSQFYSKIY